MRQFVQGLYGMGQDAKPPIVEASHVVDVFATELSAVEKLGSCVRFTFTALQRAPDGTWERVVVSRLVMPGETVTPAIKTTINDLCLPYLDFIGPSNVLVA